jgi:hypothetical protein
MSIPNKQIGWSNESNLLWYILKQLNKLTSIIFNLKPKYKVYTALLTQSGGDVPFAVTGDGEQIVLGTTYEITANPDNNDLTIYGAPNNNVGTFFVANQTTNLPYTVSLELLSNTGAPVVTVLENTIGNIWFGYGAVGNYFVYSPSIEALFPIGKTVSFIGSVGDDVASASYGFLRPVSSDIFFILTKDFSSDSDNQLNNTPIEIRVYN